MSRPLSMLVGTLSTIGIGALAAGTAHAETQKEGAIRRCGQQLGCKVIRENNGDVVIIVDDVDGDGKGGGVIRCPAGTNTCSQMRKQPPQSKKPNLSDVDVIKTR